VRAIAYGKAYRRWFEEDLDIHLWIEKRYEGPFPTKLKVHWPENGQARWRDQEIELGKDEAGGFFSDLGDFFMERLRNLREFVFGVYDIITKIPIIGDIVGAIFGKPKPIPCDLSEGATFQFSPPQIVATADAPYHCGFEPRDFKKGRGGPGDFGYPTFDDAPPGGGPGSANGPPGTPGAPGPAPGQALTDPGTASPGATYLGNTPTAQNGLIAVAGPKPKESSGGGGGGGTAGLAFQVRGNQVFALPAGTPDPKSEINLTAYSGDVVTPAAIGYPNPILPIDARLLGDLYAFARQGDKVRVLPRFSATPAPILNPDGWYKADPNYPAQTGPDAWVYDVLTPDAQAVRWRSAWLLVRHHDPANPGAGYGEADRVALPPDLVGRPRTEVEATLKLSALRIAGGALGALPRRGAPWLVSAGPTGGITVPPQVVVRDRNALLLRGVADPVVLATGVPEWVAAAAADTRAVVPGDAPGLVAWRPRQGAEPTQLALFRKDQKVVAPGPAAETFARLLADARRAEALFSHPELAPLFASATKFPLAREVDLTGGAVTGVVLEFDGKPPQRVLAAWTGSRFVVVLLRPDEGAAVVGDGSAARRAVWYAGAVRAVARAGTPRDGLRLVETGAVAFGPAEFGTAIEVLPVSGKPVARQAPEGAQAFLRAAAPELVDALARELLADAPGTERRFVGFGRSGYAILLRSRDGAWSGELVRFEDRTVVRRTVSRDTVRVGLPTVRVAGDGTEKWLIQPGVIGEPTRAELRALLSAKPQEQRFTEHSAEVLLRAALREEQAPAEPYLPVLTLFGSATPVVRPTPPAGGQSP
jgi:hypothetical protein